VVALLGAGCARTLSATVRAPHPLDATDPEARVEASYEVLILIKDIKQPEGLAHGGGPGIGSFRNAFLPGYIGPRYFAQTALLRSAARNELRFDISLTAEWRELVSLHDYVVDLRDDRNHVYPVEDRLMTPDRHRDYQATYQAWKNFQTVRIHDGTSAPRTFAMWAPEEYYVSERVYHTRGSIVFRAQDLLRPDTHALTLTLRSRMRTMRFTWIFEQTAEKAEGRSALAPAFPWIRFF
jgi:hypothetical protein